jgi:protein O-mannosyl-transferase
MLSGLFFLLALLAYARPGERAAAGRQAAVFGWMLLGGMVKSIVLVLPVLLLVLDYWPLRRGGELSGAGRVGPVETAVAGEAAAVCAGGGPGGADAGNAWHADPRQPRSFVAEPADLVAPNYFSYLRTHFWPAGLTIINPVDRLVPGLVRLGALAGVLALTGLAWRERGRRPWLLAGWLWFGAVLAPVIRGVRFDEQSAFSDRYTYLSAIGLGVVLAWGAGEVAERVRRGRPLAVVAGGLVLAACWVRTPVQLGWWRDSITLFSRAVRLAPGSAVAHNSLGQSLVEAGRVEEGERHLREAVRLQPWRADHWSNRGVALLRLRDPAAALAAHEEAVRLQPDNAQFHNHRALALAALGRTEDALRGFEEALRLRPAYAEAHYNLGGVLFGLERTAEALAHYEAAVRLAPGVALNWYNAGVALAKLGRLAEARPYVERALQLDPEIPGGRQTLWRLQGQDR